MCWDNDGYWQTLSSGDRTARKEHLCEGGDTINPGDHYKWAVGIWEGEFYTWKACDRHVAAAAALGAACRLYDRWSTNPPIDDLRQAYYEHLVEGELPLDVVPPDVVGEAVGARRSHWPRPGRALVMTAVVGLDLSMKCVGICLPDGTTEHITNNVVGALYHRAAYLRDQLRAWLLPADLVVIEDIGTRFTQTAISMGYLHCMVDGLLADSNVVKIAPAELKKWATGKGNADKHAMTVAAMRAGWNGDENSTDDEADAWWLWTIGRALCAEPVVSAVTTRKALLEKWAKA